MPWQRSGQVSYGPVIVNARPECTFLGMPHQEKSSHLTAVLRKALGIVLLLIGFAALVTPFTPGSWLILVGAGMLGYRMRPPAHLRAWWRRCTLRVLIHKQAITAMEQEVGKVVHYYDKLGVAIIELSAPLAVGDTIKVKHGEEEFAQSVTSMQVEHETVQSGKKGDSVGVKVDQKTKEGAVVFKATA